MDFFKKHLYQIMIGFSIFLCFIIICIPFTNKKKSSVPDDDRSFSEINPSADVSEISAQ